MESTLTSRVDLAEHDLLEFVVEGQHTSASNTTENVGTSTLEERLGALLGNDLGTSIEHGLVVNRSTGSHHHTTTDGIQWIGSQTSTNGNTPSETEGGKEGTLEGANKDDRLWKCIRTYNGLDNKQEMLTERVVDTEVETTVDDDTDDRRDEASVETGNTVRLEGLAVDIDETVELAISSTLGGLGVVRETGTSVVERVDEEQGRSTSSTTRGDIASEPPPITLGLFETEQGLEIILC